LGFSQKIKIIDGLKKIIYWPNFLFKKFLSFN
jgi:hypothetical protein